jgi:hypothetical protein
MILWVKNDVKVISAVLTLLLATLLVWGRDITYTMSLTERATNLLPLAGLCIGLFVCPLGELFERMRNKRS